MTERSTAPLRLLFVTPRYQPLVGGIEVHTEEVARRLVHLGHDVTVLTTDPTGRLPATELSQRVHIVRVPAWPRRADYYIAPALYQRVSEGGWDIVHCQGYQTLVAPTAMLAAMRACIPYVLSFHSGGHSSYTRNAIRGSQRTVLRPLLARAERLIAVSPFEARFFQSQLRLPPSLFTIISNGSRLEFDKHGPSPDPKNPLIVAVGRLERHKGHQYLIKALPSVLSTMPNARLRIVGTGPYARHLQRLTAELGMNGRVEIAGIEVSDRRGMAHVLQSASLVALLSDYEAQGIAVIEALALGRPVLVTYTSGLADFADEGLVRSVPLRSSPNEIAKAIVAGVQSPLVRSGVVPPSWDECTAQLLDIYRTIMMKRRT